MASSWIWKHNWPQIRWKDSALAPLLEQARAARQQLLSRLERLEPPLDLEAISALLDAELVEQQAIEPIGEGRSRAYRIHWPGGSLPGDGA